MNILLKGVIIVNAMMFIFCNSLFAQDFKVLSFSKRPAELQVLNRTFFISEVIDARNVPSRNHIGYVQGGLSNMKCEAVFKKSANQAIAEYLKIALPYYPEMDSLILKINRLNVSEKTAMATETAFLTAEFDLIRKTPQGYFLIDNQKIDYSERNLGDVTKMHIPNIEMALEEAFKKFHSKRRWALPVDSLLALSQADLMRIPKAAILKDSILKEGIYKYFSDFRDNNPSMPYAFEKSDNGDKLSS